MVASMVILSVSAALMAPPPISNNLQLASLIKWYALILNQCNNKLEQSIIPEVLFSRMGFCFSTSCILTFFCSFYYTFPAQDSPTESWWWWSPQGRAVVQSLSTSIASQWLFYGPICGNCIRGSSQVEQSLGDFGDILPCWYLCCSGCSWPDQK